MALAETLARSGIPYPTAVEIARQIYVGGPIGGDANRMMTSGIPTAQAVELASQINAGVYSASRLASSGWPSIVARVVDANASVAVELVPTVVSESSPKADAWCWFHEPRAVAANGKVWFGTSGSDDNTANTDRATIHELNEATGVVTHVNLKVASGYSDDHTYPVVLIRPDGRLIAFYCAHKQSAPIYFKVSVNAYDASAWSQEYSIAVSALLPTYPSPVMLTAESNKIYLFFRDGTDGSLTYITSANLAGAAAASSGGGSLGVTPAWGSPVKVVNQSDQGIYHKVHSNGIDRIDIAMTDAVESQDGTKNDVRHTYFTGGNWYTTAGVSLGNAASPIAFSSFTAVATSGAPDSLGDMWIDHMQRRPSGVIEVVFRRLVSVTDERAYYARWNGSAWSKVEIDAGTGATPDTRSSQITDNQGSSEGYYSPGMYLDTADTGVVYVSVGNSDYSHVYRYTTTNGSTFVRSRISSSTGENVRPVVPLNRSTKYAVLWMSGAYHQFFFNFNSKDNTIGYATTIKAASRSYSTPDTAPVNISGPAINGAVQSGAVLTTTNGVFTGGEPLVFTYQWKKAGVNIGGATSSSYTVQAGDVGTSITVAVTATNYLGSASATSAAAVATIVNMLTKSAKFDLWSMTNTTASADVAANPLTGTTTADRVAETTASGQHTIFNATPNFVAGQQYTCSVYVKYETKQYLQIFLGGAAHSAAAFANFDIQNGTVVRVGPDCTAAIESVGNGWYRISITAVAMVSNFAPVVVTGITASGDGRGPTYVGSASNTWLQYGAQAELGPRANTYADTA